jgi:hypothetical protein
MKTRLAFLCSWLSRITALLLLGTNLFAAPLAWFPGPSLNEPLSGAATIVASGGIILIGGDTFFDSFSYPQKLTITNAYWTYLPALDSVRISAGAVSSGDFVIVFGGSDGTNSMSTALAYSLSGDAAPVVPSMSVARSQLGYAPDKSGRAYAIGGLDDNGQALASAERYDFDVNTWTPIASLPTPLYQFPAVFNRTNYIYVFGGSTDPISGVESSSVFRYSISGNSWSMMAPMPVAVAASSAAFGPDGKIYVVGGLSGGIATNTVQVYDPIANSWSISSPLPEALSAAAMGVDTLGRLVVTGGKDVDGNDVSDTWRSQQLGLPDSAPTFVSYPSLSASYQVPYTSSINATGSPPPTYLLLSGPDGMQIDFFSGAITWTPQANQIGTNAVSIRATNFAGFADYDFTLVITNPKPAIVSNLTVVAVTETSVTLAWDPEDTLYGDVTYAAYLRHVVHSPRGSGVTIYYTQIGTNTTVPTLTITGLTPGLSQSYYVAAIGPGGKSGYASVAATTWAPQPPPNLRVTGLTSTSIALTWDPSPGPVPIASYEIWGWINNGVTSAIYGTGITDTNFTITGLTPGSVHEWGVRAHDALGYASGFDYGPTVQNPIPTPALLSAITPTAAGGMQLNVQSSVIQTTLIQATTNLADPTAWTTIGSIYPSSATFTFTDTNANQFDIRFYRVVSP